MSDPTRPGGTRKLVGNIIGKGVPPLPITQSRPIIKGRRKGSRYRSSQGLSRLHAMCIILLPPVPLLPRSALDLSLYPHTPHESGGPRETAGADDRQSAELSRAAKYRDKVPWWATRPPSRGRGAYHCSYKSLALLRSYPP